MKYIVFLIITVMGATASAERLYGLDRMERFDLLPQLLPGTQVRQVSSYDRSGENDDGFNGTYSYLYVDNGEYVLFDELGAGCLYRFWMTYGNSPADYSDNLLRFYFDNEESPRLELSIAEFFDGVGAPLEFPLVGPFNKSSHGCYCYLPFPYQERLKITLSGLPLFYNMTYHYFDSEAGVVSWTGNEDQTAVLSQWNAVGSDPKSATSNLVVSGEIPLVIGGTGTIFSVIGAGAVQSIKLDPSLNSTNILSKVWIQMNWDGGDLEVDAPLGDFFGSGKYEINVSSLPIGMKTSGDWYCYFPMPYWESAEVTLVNRGEDQLNSLPFEVQYTTDAYSQIESGYFHARFHEESFVNNGRDFNFIDEQGRGHVVGVSLFMESAGAGGYQDMNYLEGDERAYVDGCLSPCIHGTGNEDYFNCGWYFNMGTFSRPYHGHPWRDQFNGGGTNYTQAYRFHLSDVIPFNKKVNFGVEHGHRNESPGTYSSVTYYYKMGGSASGLELIADLDLGDAWSENVYDYQHPSVFQSVSNAWSYEGDDDDVLIQDEGYSHQGSIAEFTIPISASEGLLLRRRTDQGVGGQEANVFVDDIFAGVWYESDHNFESVPQRWRDSEFMVPANFVTGKTSVCVGIFPLSTSVWNAYRYWIYSMMPTGALLDSDGDQLPDEWELDVASTLTNLSGHVDSDLDGFSNYDEYISGTEPLVSSSFPKVSFVMYGEDVGIQTYLGRLYDVQESESLTSNDWKFIRSKMPGTGSLLSIPLGSGHSQSFYRFLVEKP